jgi:fatty acid synthase subunit alpha
VKYSAVKDEPIKDLLGNITSILVQKLLERSYGGDASKIPIVDYLAPVPEEVETPEGVAYEETAKSVTYTIGDVIPDTKEWLQALSGSELSWIKALLMSETIVQGSAYIDNPLRRALAPRRGQKVVIGMDNGLPTSLTIYGGGRSHGTHKPDFKAVEIKYTASSKLIDVKFYEDRRNVSVPLALQFKYVPSAGAIPIQEVAVGRNHRIKEFYWKLWFGDDEEMPEIDIHETFIGPEVTISARDVEMFCGVVGNQSEAFKTAHTEVVKAPMDFAIVTGWQVHVSMRVCFWF